MAISQKELKQINRHCSCGKPSFLFIKYYKWPENNTKWLPSSGIFNFCNDSHCAFYFRNFLKIDEIREDKFYGNECYYMATEFTVDILPEI